MDFAPCTFAFEKLSAAPLAHMRLGDLAQIHQPDVHGVQSTRALSPAAIDYLHRLDLTEMIETARPGASTQARLSKISLTGDGDVAAHHLGDSLSRTLAPHLPEAQGKSAVLQDLQDSLSDLCACFKERADPQGKQPFSGKINYFLLAIRPSVQGIFHRDNHTECRALITLKGAGTLLADESVRSRIDLPHALPERELTQGSSANNYGRPSENFAALIRQADPHHLLIWRGEIENTPAIHCEPDVLSREDQRLILIATPVEMSARESQRAKAASLPTRPT